jgi:hypothetical protein
VGQTGHHYENMRLNSYIPCSRMSRWTKYCQVWTVTFMHWWSPQLIWIVMENYARYSNQKVSVINTWFCKCVIMITKCISPDKKMFVISNFDKIDSESKTYKSSFIRYQLMEEP